MNSYFRVNDTNNHKTLAASEFVDTFRSSVRGDDQFTDEGLITLFNYLKNEANETGKAIEFDVRSFCLEFAEEWPEDIADFYHLGDLDMQAVVDYLQRHGMYVGQTSHGTILYRALPC